MVEDNKTQQPDEKRSEDFIKLYQQSDKIYTRSFTGFFRNLRMLGAGFLVLLYFGMVWLSCNGNPAILFDLPARKFHILGTIFWPQDFVLLSWLLIICAFSLFTVTVLVGRVWCGYTCPQSVFTWIFLWIENFIEGDKNKRMRLDGSSFSLNKLTRKIVKHGLWMFVGFITGFTFVGYFTPIKILFVELLNFNLSTWESFWLLFFTLATYLNAGWLREKVCLHMCPYARFQSVMFDSDTLIVAYDEKRGEARGSRKKNSNYKEKGLGDCIDCQLCVQVCPTGIDIRNGLQMGCIGCAACVDVCDNIMDKMGYDKGLVSYTTENQLSNGTKKKWLSPRFVGYLTILVLMCSAFAWSMSTRELISMEVLRDRNVLFRITDDNRIVNSYILKLVNKTNENKTIALTFFGIEGLDSNDKKSFVIDAGSVTEQIINLSINKKSFSKNQDVDIVATVVSDNASKPITSIHKKNRFLGPMH